MFWSQNELKLIYNNYNSNYIQNEWYLNVAFVIRGITIRVYLCNQILVSIDYSKISYLIVLNKYGKFYKVLPCYPRFCYLRDILNT